MHVDKWIVNKMSYRRTHFGNAAVASFSRLALSELLWWCGCQVVTAKCSDYLGPHLFIRFLQSLRKNMSRPFILELTSGSRLLLSFRRYLYPLYSCNKLGPNTVNPAIKYHKSVAMATMWWIYIYSVTVLFCLMHSKKRMPELIMVFDTTDIFC